LPYLRPDLAVLLQNDLFNTDVNNLGLDLDRVDPDWVKETKEIIVLPVHLNEWREKIWGLIEHSIFQQVSSFVDLAMALTTLSKKMPENGANIDFNSSKGDRLTNQVTSMLQGAADDSMRQFLQSVVEYISSASQNSTQLPIDTVRALHDIERILKIDVQLLSEKEQAKLNYYILQMARMAMENG